MCMVSLSDTDTFDERSLQGDVELLQSLQHSDQRVHQRSVLDQRGVLVHLSRDGAICEQRDPVMQQMVPASGRQRRRLTSERRWRASPVCWRASRATPWVPLALPGAEADEHLELAVLADVPGRAVDGAHEAAEVVNSGLPVFIRRRFSLLSTFKVDLRLFCNTGKVNNTVGKKKQKTVRRAEILPK